MRAFFAGAGEHLRETDFADACPIATVALEVSSTSEPMRRACAEVFERWIDAGVQRFVAGGCSEQQARELAIAMFAALEGAFVLARAQRSTEGLAVAGELIATAVERAPARLARNPSARGARLARRPVRRRQTQDAHRL